MIRNKENKSKVISFRVPPNIFELYEQYCIEEHIYMAEILRDAVDKAVKKKLQEDKKRDLVQPHQ